MITKDRFTEIDTEIKNLVRTSLNDLRTNRFEDYILYIADGDYNDEFDTNPKYSPYVIDNRIDLLKDDTRLKFLVRFLSTFYIFPLGTEEINDDEYRIYMELMTYSHIWESKSFLRKLGRFAHLCNGEIYLWKLDIPEMGRHTFIRDNIRKTFEDCHNDLSEVIRKGFHTSLRNAFAHSEFHIDNYNSKIILHNYNGNDTWELRDITFNDWSERFCYSILLCYHLLKESYSDRENIIDLNGGKNVFEIKHPKRDGNSHVLRNIEYHKDANSFTFQR